MHIVSLKTLRSYWRVHPDSAQPLRAWYENAQKARWLTPNDIKAVYRNASFVGKNRIVFNIKGNSYRLIVKVEYKKGRMFVRFIGTHAEYDRIDPKMI